MVLTTGSGTRGLLLCTWIPERRGPWTLDNSFIPAEGILSQLEKPTQVNAHVNHGPEPPRVGWSIEHIIESVQLVVLGDDLLAAPLVDALTPVVDYLGFRDKIKPLAGPLELA